MAGFAKEVIIDSQADGSLGIDRSLTYNDAGTIGRGSTIYVGVRFRLSYAGISSGSIPLSESDVAVSGVHARGRRVNFAR